MTNAKRDQNYVPVMLGVSNADSTTTLPVQIDSVTGKVLVQGTGVSGALDMVKVYQNAATTLVDFDWTTMRFEVEAFDSNAMHTSGATDSRITIKTTGTYMIGGQVAVTSASALSPGFRIIYNGSTSSVIATQKQGASGDNPETCSISTLTQLNAGDYIQAQAFVLAGGGGPHTTTGNSATNFWAILLSI